MDEYIKREDAIKAFPKADADIFENCRNCTCLDSDQINYILNNIPSADVVERPKWISVKDRLPKESGQYLVTGKWKDTARIYWICFFYKSLGSFQCFGWANNAKNPPVEAWMPILPYCGAEMEVEG